MNIYSDVKKLEYIGLKDRISQTRLANSERERIMLENVNNKMIEEITNLVNQMKSNLTLEINKSIVNVYWNIGRIIVSNENENNNRLEYGKEVLKGLSDELTKYLGKGYSVSNLKYMRVFYKAYPNYEELNEKLSCSHYLELMIIRDKDKRTA